MDCRHLLLFLCVGVVLGGDDGDFRPLVRLAKGRRLFQVGAREPSYGFYTQLTFSRTRCIRSLTIDSLRPLTGAEEIDLVFSPCASGADDWQVAHYSNRENVFRLERDTFAHKFSVVSPNDISVIDVGVQPCDDEYGTVQRYLKQNGTSLCETATPATPTTTPATTTVPLYQAITEQHRHRHRIHPHRTFEKENPKNDGGRTTRVSKRVKRSLESDDETACKGDQVYCEASRECVASERECLGTNECDFFCFHGHCDAETRSCVCDDSWSGAACDVCLSEDCPVRPTVRFILPQTISVEEKNAFVFAHGNDFPPGPNESKQRYTCFFGGLATEGRWMSPTLIRCTVPPAAYVGRHAFNVFPFGESKPIASEHGKTIHFTFFLPCSPRECHGYCHGPLCVCPHGMSGPKCTTFDFVAESKRIIDDAKMTTAHEGVPYHAVLPVQSSVSIVRVETDAEGLIVDPFESTVLWSHPIGSKTPYNVSVHTRDVATSAEHSWQITVAPTYSVSVESAEPIDGTNKFAVSGNADFRSHPVIPYAPLSLHVFQGRNLRESMRLRTNGNATTFDFVVTPFVDGEQSYSVRATQPNDDENLKPGDVSYNYTTFEVSYDESLQATSHLSVTAEVVTKIDGSPTAVACHVDVVFPREKVFVAKNSSNFTSSKQGNVGITLEILNLEEKTKIYLLYSCENTNSFVSRHNFIPSSNEIVLTAVPSRLTSALTIESTFGEPLHLEVHSAVPMCKMTVNVKPKLDPLFVIAAESDMRCTKFSVVLGVDSLAILKANRRIVRGSFTVSGNNEHSIIIPYDFRLNADSIFPVTLTVSAPPYHYRSENVKSEAIVLVENPNLNVSLTTSVVFDAPTAISFFTKGFYVISVSSPSYESFKQIVKFTSSNSTLSIVLRPKSSEVVVSNKGSLFVEDIWDSQIPYTPKMSISPNSVRVADHAAVVQVDYVGGPRNSTVILIPRINDPSLPFNFTMKSIDYGITVGSGYKTSVTVSPHATYSNLRCNAFVVPVDFFYLVPRASVSFQATTHVVLDGRTTHEEQVQFCSKTPSAQQTSVRCNCAVSALANCKRYYQPLVSCGAAWKLIPDDTVSMHTVTLFLMMKTKCAEMGVELGRVRMFLKCVEAISNDCPFVTEESEGEISRMGGSNPAKLINHIRNIGYANYVFQKFFPQVQTFQSQTTNVPAIILDFLEELEVVLPEEETRSLRDFHDLNQFFASIADDSDEGAFISWDERANFSADVSKELLNRWNHTVEEFSDGGFQFSPSKEFVALGKLVSKADLLKSLSRQYGENSPFSLFHSAVSRIFANVDLKEEPTECARAFVLSDAREVEEQREFRVRIRISNQRPDAALGRIRINTTMVRVGAEAENVLFRMGPIFVSGLPSIDGLHALHPMDNVSVEWIVTSVPSISLTRPSTYQPMVLFSYELNGKKMVQRLNANPVTIVPRRRMKLRYFVYPTVSLSSRDKRPFTFMVSIINSGYSPLRNVQILESNPWLTLAAAPNTTANYRLVSVSSSSGKRLPTNFRQSLGEIPSGASENLLYNISTSDEKDVLLRSINSVVSVDGDALLPLDSKIFFIHQTVSSNSFLVSESDVPFSLFLFDSKKSTISSLQQLHFLQMAEEKGDAQRLRFLAAFRHATSDVVSGPVLCSLNHPDVPSNFIVERIFHVDPLNLAKRRDVSANQLWVGEGEGARTLNFIDDQLSRSPSGQEFYEIIFGSPDDLHRPVFGQELYRIEVKADDWPKTGAELGTIGAKSPTHSDLRYHLVSNGNAPYFGVNTKTGTISLVADLPRAPADYCLNLIVIDAARRHSVAPLTIDTGANQRNVCAVYANSSAVIDYFYEKDFKTPSKVPSGTVRPAVTPISAPTTKSTEAPKITVPVTEAPVTVPEKEVTEDEVEGSTETTVSPDGSPEHSEEGSSESESSETTVPLETVTQRIHSISADPTLLPYSVTGVSVTVSTHETTMEEVPTAITHSIIEVSTEPTTVSESTEHPDTVTQEGTESTVTPHDHDSHETTDEETATVSTTSEIEPTEGTIPTVIIGPDHTLEPVRGAHGQERTTDTESSESAVTAVVGPDGGTLQSNTVTPMSTYSTYSNHPDITLPSATEATVTDEYGATHLISPDSHLEPTVTPSIVTETTVSDAAETVTSPEPTTEEVTEATETTTPEPTTRRRILLLHTVPPHKQNIQLVDIGRACRQRDRNPLWGLICDIAKTVHNAEELVSSVSIY